MLFSDTFIVHLQILIPERKVVNNKNGIVFNRTNFLSGLLFNTLMISYNISNFQFYVLYCSIDSYSYTICTLLTQDQRLLFQENFVNKPYLNHALSLSFWLLQYSLIINLISYSEKSEKHGFKAPKKTGIDKYSR